MAAYASGDRDAFDALFSVLAPRVHGFFVRRFGDISLADDLLQVTFMKIHRARSDYRTGAPLRPWVFTIAARVGLDEFRRRRRRPEDSEEASQQRADRERAAERAGHDPVESAQISEQVRAALAELPDSQRVVVLLHRYEGLTFEQIGGVLGTTEGAVKLRAFRAYERLRKVLRPLMEELRGRPQTASAVTGA